MGRRALALVCFLCRRSSEALFLRVFCWSSRAPAFIQHLCRLRPRTYADLLPPLRSYCLDAYPPLFAGFYSAVSKHASEPTTGQGGLHSLPPASARSIARP